MWRKAGIASPAALGANAASVRQRAKPVSVFPFSFYSFGFYAKGWMNMRKDAWLFAGPLLILSGAGVLLRSLELRSSLDPDTMIMDFKAPSGLLLGLTAAVLLLLLVLCRRLPETKNGGSYGQVFGRPFMPFVSGAALVLCLAGALICLKQRHLSAAPDALTLLLALLGALAGVSWFSLSLSARRGGKGSFGTALLPVLFGCLFLVFYYKNFAQLPALLYTMYPFLALCAALAALHLLAGWTVGKPRKKPALLCAGLGTYFSVVACVNGDHPAFLPFFAALALELIAHGVCLMTAPEFPAAEEAPAADAPAEDAPAEKEATEAEAEEAAPAAEAEAEDASESADPEAPAGEGKMEE